MRELGTVLDDFCEEVKEGFVGGCPFLVDAEVKGRLELPGGLGDEGRALG